MRWQDVDSRFPDQGWSSGLDRIPVAATHLARAALGLPTRELPRELVVAAISENTHWYSARALGDEDAWRGLMALSAAQLGDWDLVAAVTGGAMLGTRVVVKKTFGADTRAFARHLATAVRAKLPAQQVLAAMVEQRTRFVDNTAAPDARTVVIAASLFVRELGAARDPIEATQRWLAGEELEPLAAPAKRAVADGEDPRVKIFERYAPEIDDVEIDRIVALVHAQEPWGRHLERERIALDDLAIRAYVARRPLFASWATLVDPIVGVWLGIEPTPATERRFRDFALLAGGMKLDRGWDEALKALAMGKTEAVRTSTGAGKLPTFKPGLFFKDDGRKLLRYLASAIDADASAADVEPAWHDFLARRSPKTTTEIEGSPLRWKHLLMVQAAITQQIGKCAPTQIGSELRRAITGSVA